MACIFCRRTIVHQIRQCSVIYCSSFKRNPEQLFKVFYTWNEIVQKINGSSNRRVAYICAEHFSNEDSITTYNGPNDSEKVK